MKLSTSFPIPESSIKISPSDAILSMGSCFSENMGSLLERLPMRILNQPLGTLFHPFSIQRALSKEALLESECFTENDFFVHPDFHSKFTSRSKEKLMNEIRSAQQETIAFCQNSQWLIITLGTAFYYFDKKLQRPIANCHKQASSQFEKRLSSSDEISTSFIPFLKHLKNTNPQLNIILSVSPVRHTKDGMMENSLSKSILRVAVNDIVQAVDFVHYFPAFEIVLDELRDYRFYGPDLIHPNEIAIEYIWEKFKTCFFDDALLNIDKTWTNYWASIQHRAHPEKQGIQNTLLEKILDEIKTKYSHLSIRQTEEIIKSRILPIS